LIFEKKLCFLGPINSINTYLSRFFKSTQLEMNEKGSLCCGYGTDAMMTFGYDCVTIPGAVKNTADMNAAPERICGRQFVTATKGMAALAKTICSEFCFCIIRGRSQTTLTSFWLFLTT
jgi:hypothetical protein